MTRPITSYGLRLLGGGVLVNAVVAAALSNMSTGILLCAVIGAMLLLCGWLYTRLHKAIKITLLAMCCLVATAVALLFGYGKADTVTYTEDIVIVLGAGIQGDQPSKSLQNRLDRAVAYHRQNPHALIVVSGGQGPQETVTEATAMERYLIAHGVPSSSILKEEAATSTTENFRFCKELLETHPDIGSVAVITTDYHIYRAMFVARRVGFDNVTHCHSKTPWYMILPNGLRECVAVCRYWITR